MSDGFVDAGGLRLHYQEWRPGNAAGTVVLVHGLGSSSHIWDLAGPLLADWAQVRVVALDQRGHGESGQPESGYDFPSVVADLAAFMDSVGIAAPAVLVGHSWGASVVLHFAVGQPERTAGLVLVDGGTASPGERWTWAETEARLTPPDIDGQEWTDLHGRMTANNAAYADPRTEAVGRSLFNVDAHGRVARRFRISNHMQVVRALWEQHPAELLPRVSCPLLILPARQSTDAAEWRASKAASVERALGLQPQARVHWFEDTVHDVPLQRPEELARELQAFAASVLSERVGEAYELGERLTVVGRKLEVGDAAPDVPLETLDSATGGVRTVRPSDWAGKVRLLNIVNSLDTPVCDVETRRWDTARTDLSPDVQILTISMDLPFAQARWCGAANAAHPALSAHKSEDFGRAYGVLLKEWRLLQRAVFVLDRSGMVTYAEYVADQMAEPNYNAALDAVRRLP